MDQPPRALVVDDDEPVRNMLGLAFELDGYEVASASDGLEAIIQVARFEPDIVVLDIMMPRMDGLTALGHLRREPATATLPVIILSAKADSADIAIGIRAGATDYITKPFDTEDLLERARTAMVTAPARVAERSAATVPAGIPAPPPPPPLAPAADVRVTPDPSEDLADVSEPELAAPPHPLTPSLPYADLTPFYTPEDEEEPVAEGPHWPRGRPLAAAIALVVIVVLLAAWGLPHIWF